MYKPQFKMTKRGVPVLSKDQMDEIAEDFIRDFSPNALIEPTEIDIDKFALSYLKLNQDFQYLSHNGIYLGMTVCNDTNKIPVYIPETDSAEYISARARTVIIDNGLLEENQEHRYRYTMGHECGHDIYHTTYFSYDPMQTVMFETQPMLECSIVSKEESNKPKGAWTDKDWMEWQANYMSSALLMPRTMVFKLIRQVTNCKSILKKEAYVGRLVKTFNVSAEAAFYRLKGLGVLKESEKIPKDFEQNQLF